MSGLEKVIDSINEIIRTEDFYQKTLEVLEYRLKNALLVNKKPLSAEQEQLKSDLLFLIERFKNVSQKIHRVLDESDMQAKLKEIAEIDEQIAASNDGPILVQRKKQLEQEIIETAQKWQLNNILKEMSFVFLPYCFLYTRTPKEFLSYKKGEPTPSQPPSVSKLQQEQSFVGKFAIIDGNEPIQRFMRYEILMENFVKNLSKAEKNNHVHHNPVDRSIIHHANREKGEMQDLIEEHERKLANVLKAYCKKVPFIIEILFGPRDLLKKLSAGEEKLTWQEMRVISQYLEKRLSSKDKRAFKNDYNEGFKLIQQKLNNVLLEASGPGYIGPIFNPDSQADNPYDCHQPQPLTYGQTPHNGSASADKSVANVPGARKPAAH